MAWLSLKDEALGKGYVFGTEDEDPKLYIRVGDTVHMRINFVLGSTYVANMEDMAKCMQFAHRLTKYRALEQLLENLACRTNLLGWWDQAVTAIQGIQCGAMDPNDSTTIPLASAHDVVRRLQTSVACVAVASAKTRVLLLTETLAAMQQVAPDQCGASFHADVQALQTTKTMALTQLINTLQTAGGQDASWIASLANDAMEGKEDADAVNLWVMNTLASDNPTAANAFALGTETAACYVHGPLVALAAAGQLVCTEFARARRQALLPPGGCMQVGTMEPEFIHGCTLCMLNTRGAIDAAITCKGMASMHGLEGMLALCDFTLETKRSFMIICHSLDPTEAEKRLHGTVAMITQQHQLQGVHAAATSGDGKFAALERELTKLRCLAEGFGDIPAKLQSMVQEVIAPVVSQAEAWMHARGADAAAGAPAEAAAAPAHAAPPAPAAEPASMAAEVPGPAPAAVPPAAPARTPLALPRGASHPVTPAAALPAAADDAALDSLVDSMQRCRINVLNVVQQAVAPSRLDAAPSTSSFNPLFSESEEGFLEIRGTLQSETREVLAMLQPSPPRVLRGRNGVSPPKAGPSGPAARAACPPITTVPPAGRRGGGGAAASPAVSRLGRGQAAGGARGVNTRATRQQAPATAAPAAAAGGSGTTATPSTGSRQPAARRAMTYATPTPSRTGPATRSRAKSGTQ